MSMNLKMVLSLLVLLCIGCNLTATFSLFLSPLSSLITFPVHVHAVWIVVLMHATLDCLLG